MLQAKENCDDDCTKGIMVMYAARTHDAVELGVYYTNTAQSGTVHKTAGAG
jgi:hypothetical protein